MTGASAEQDPVADGLSVDDRVLMLRRSIYRSALYHEARTRSLTFFQKLGQLTSVLLGSAVAADIGSNFLGGREAQRLLFGAAVSVVGALQLVLDFGASARTHQKLHEQFVFLLAEIARAAKPSESELKVWDAKRIEIGASSPPKLTSVDAVAYNQAYASLYPDPKEENKLHIPLFILTLGWILPFNGHFYRTKKEEAEVRAARWLKMRSWLSSASRWLQKGKAREERS